MERHVCLGAGRSGRGHRQPGVGGTGPWPSASSSGTGSGTPTVVGGGVGSAKAGRDTWPAPATTPGWSTASPGWASSPVRRAGPGGRWARPKTSSRCSSTWRAAASSPPVHDAERLIVRTKELSDGATPSANAVAAQALARLGALTGDEAYTGSRPRRGRHVRLPAGRAPGRLRPDRAHRRRPGRRASSRSWSPAIGPTSSRWPGGGGCRMPSWPGASRPSSPLWRDREPGRAYVCRHYACHLPTDDPTTLATQLDEASGRPPGPR